MIIIKNAIENIKTNKLRVAVAMIWIVLGITSVIVVSSIGNGIESVGNKNLDDSKFRKQTIEFCPNYESDINPDFFEPFSSDDIDKISIIKGIERVTPKYGQSGGLSYGGQLFVEDKDEFNEFVEYTDKLKLDIQYGRGFSLEDLDRKTIVIEYTTAYNLFEEEPKSAIGKSVDINGEQFEVIGVLKDLEFSSSDSQYRQPKVYIPSKALEELSNQQSFGSTISGLEILVLKGYDVDEVSFNIKSMLESIKSTEDGTYELTGGNEQAHELDYMQQTINKFTSVISKVSLIIGGIGIMNIMYMSVSERQREIGIRRAIGAEPKDILLQFLIETVVITIIGGIVGMIVGTFIADYTSGYLGIEAIPTVAVYLKAVVVSILTGVIFGSIPAYKASNLDPIKAIQG